MTTGILPIPVCGRFCIVIAILPRTGSLFLQPLNLDLANGTLANRAQQGLEGCNSPAARPLMSTGCRGIHEAGLACRKTEDDGQAAKPSWMPQLNIKQTYTYK